MPQNDSIRSSIAFKHHRDQPPCLLPALSQAFQGLYVREFLGLTESESQFSQLARLSDAVWRFLEVRVQRRFDPL